MTRSKIGYSWDVHVPKPEERDGLNPEEGKIYLGGRPKTARKVIEIEPYTDMIWFTGPYGEDSRRCVTLEKWRAWIRGEMPEPETKRKRYPRKQDPPRR